jgi:hypothetical protein
VPTILAPFSVLLGVISGLFFVALAHFNQITNLLLDQNYSKYKEKMCG